MIERRMNGNGYLSKSEFRWIVGIMLIIGGGIIGTMWRSQVVTAEKGNATAEIVSGLKENDRNKDESIKRVEDKVDAMDTRINAKIDRLLELIPRNPNRNLQ